MLENYGNQNVNHQHAFWDCSVIKDYWRGIHKALQDICECEIPFAIKTIYFGSIHQDWSKGDTLLIEALLVAGKKHHQQMVVTDRRTQL